MKIKYIILIAIAALAMVLASAGAIAPSIGGSKPGVSGGQTLGDNAAPRYTISGGKGGGSGEVKFGR